MCECDSCYQQQLILYKPAVSVSLSEAAGAAVLFSSLAMATPVICRWFIWQRSREHLARQGDRACRLYSRHAFVCVCVCVCNSLGDFRRAQLKLREDNVCLCTHTHTHTHTLRFKDMCWHFPRLSLRDVWACQCCNTILNLCECV